VYNKGVSVAFVRVRDSVRENMRRAGTETAVGPANFYERITGGVRAWLQQAREPVCTSARTPGASHESR
jgi:hypothetical protein